MKIHPGTVVVPLAIVLLVGAAGAVLATSGGTSTQTPGAPAAETASPGATTAPAPSTGTATAPDRKDTALSDVLDDLVADGTITADQRQAILDAVTAERQARLEERKAQHGALKAQREQLRGFLSDGVITQEEFDQLPADSPLKTLTSLMDDGQITTDELRQLGRGLFLGGGHGRGHGFWGPKGDGAQPAPDATPTPSPTTGS